MFDRVGALFSAPLATRLLNVLSVFAIFALLYLELQLPLGRYCLEPILKPDEVLTVAPVGRHEHSGVVLFCLRNLPRYLVGLDVPEDLSVNDKLL